MGALIRAARVERRLSLKDLASAAGVSFSTVSLIERGRLGTTFATAERILGAMGLQLHVETQPLWEGIDAAIAEAAGRPLTERIGTWEIEFTSLVSWFAGTPYLADGLMAAALQGAPVPVTAFEVAVADDDESLDELTFLLDEMRARRWVAKWGDWGGFSNDPRDADGWPVRYRCVHGEIHVRAVSALTPTVWVEVDPLPSGCLPPLPMRREIPVLTRVRLPVVPLAEIEYADGHPGRVLDRMRLRGVRRP